MRTILFSSLFLCQMAAFAVEPVPYTFKLLATTKTSSMEKEMNAAAEAGYVFQSVMGGETALGGKEVVVVMGKASESESRKTYKLLAANKTSTLESEMQAIAREGFEYRGQTIFEATFGGRARSP